MKDAIAVDGKVIIITGGNGFLGSQWRDSLRTQGAEVIVFDRNDDAPVDITDPTAVKTRVAEIVKKHGTIDGVIHSAAMDAVPGSPDSARQFAPYEQYPLELWEKAFTVNLTAAQIVTQAIAPEMMKAKKGSVVFVASELALAAPNNTLYEEGKFKDIAYVASKAGVLGLMRAWAAYLGPHGARSNAIAPGGMQRSHSAEFAKKYGQLNLLGRMAKEGEYNGAMTFLLSDASSFMTGSTLVIDGGRTAW